MFDVLFPSRSITSCFLLEPTQLEDSTYDEICWELFLGKASPGDFIHDRFSERSSLNNKLERQEGRWRLGRNDALGKNSAEEPNFQEIPMAAFLLGTSGGWKSGWRVLLLREASSASRKVRLRSTTQKSHAQCHQLWELQKHAGWCKFVFRRETEKSRGERVGGSLGHDHKST